MIQVIQTPFTENEKELMYQLRALFNEDDIIALKNEIVGYNKQQTAINFPIPLGNKKPVIKVQTTAEFNAGFNMKPNLIIKLESNHNAELTVKSMW